MTRMTFRAGDTLVAFERLRFSSDRQAHRKFFKHVIGLTAPGEARSREVDPERWNELIDDPPLPASFRKRRESSLRVLEGVPGCKLGCQATAGSSVCVSCDDGRARAAVTTALKEPVVEYERVGAEAVAWAIANASSRGQRMIGFRHKTAGGAEVIRFRTIDTRKVSVVSQLAPVLVPAGASPTLALVTVFRDDAVSYRTAWYELNRESAGHRTAGTHVPVGMATAASEVRHVDG